MLSCCTFFYFTYLQIFKISLTSASFCKQQLFFSDIHCCITDTVPCQDRCFGADASSSCIRKCSFFVNRFLKNKTNVKLCIFQFSQSWEETIRNSKNWHVFVLWCFSLFLKTHHYYFLILLIHNWIVLSDNFQDFQRKNDLLYQKTVDKLHFAYALLDIVPK